MALVLPDGLGDLGEVMRLLLADTEGFPPSPERGRDETFCHDMPPYVWCVTEAAPRGRGWRRRVLLSVPRGRGAHGAVCCVLAGATLVGGCPLAAGGPSR